MRYSKEGSSGKGNHEGCLSVRSYFYGLSGSTLRLQRENREPALCWVHQADVAGRAVAYMLTASSGSQVPVKGSTLDKAVLPMLWSFSWCRWTPALVMHAADRTCGHGDDVCAGVGDAGAGLRMR